MAEEFLKNAGYKIGKRDPIFKERLVFKDGQPIGWLDDNNVLRSLPLYYSRNLDTEKILLDVVEQFLLSQGLSLDYDTRDQVYIKVENLTEASVQSMHDLYDKLITSEFSNKMEKMVEEGYKKAVSEIKAMVVEFLKNPL